MMTFAHATIKRACGCLEDMLFASQEALDANRKRLESTLCFRKSCHDRLGVRPIEQRIQDRP